MMHFRDLLLCVFRYNTCCGFAFREVCLLVCLGYIFSIVFVRGLRVICLVQYRAAAKSFKGSC